MTVGDVSEALSNMQKRLEIVSLMRSIADKHPEESVQVIRSWMRSGMESEQEIRLRESLQLSEWFNE